MAASVRIEDEAFADSRIELLGILAGYNRYEALGRMAHLWRLCTQRDAHTVPDSWVVSCLGDRGPTAIVGADLGEATADGIRVKGTVGRIEWLKRIRANSKAGGAANKAKHVGSALAIQTDSQTDSLEAPKEPRGYPLGYPEGSQDRARREPEPSPPTPTPTPNTNTDPPNPRSGGESEEKPKRIRKRDAKPRERCPLFDILAEVTASDSTTAGSFIAKTRNLLAKAEPPYTPEEVREFAARFHELCNWARGRGMERPTLVVIQKNIKLVRVKPTVKPDESAAMRELILNPPNAAPMTFKPKVMTP